MSNDGTDRPRTPFRKVESVWTAQELVSQKGWFPFADVMRLLDPEDTGQQQDIRNRRQNLVKIKRDPAHMGLQQFGQRLWADMSIFAPWFLAYQRETVVRLQTSMTPRPLQGPTLTSPTEPHADTPGLGLYNSIDT